MLLILAENAGCPIADALWNLGGVFLGAFLGIPAGLYVNHHWEAKQTKAKAEQLRLAMRSLLDRNITILNRINELLDRTETMVFRTLDSSFLDATASLKYELFDIDVCKEIDEVRYDIVHSNRGLDVLLEFEFNPTNRMAIAIKEGSRYNKIRPLLIASLKAEIPALTNSIKSLLQKLN